jgi:hypothetical protein
MNRCWAMAAALLLAGCAMTDPLPDGYAGPTASIQDSIEQRSDLSIAVFFVSQVNGKAVENAYSRTVEVNKGRGLAMEPQNYHRVVAAAPMTIKIDAAMHFAAPIVGILNLGSNYDLSGEMPFTPEAGHNYRVMGELGEHHCAVWMIDLATDSQVGRKFEADSC